MNIVKYTHFMGGVKMKLGSNIQRRRKKLKLSQQELANNDWTRSYISQIESDRLQPPLASLAIIAAKLDTTISDLVGDQLLLDKAKTTICYPNICKNYLAQLPKTPTTIFLYQLTNSLQTNKSLDYQIPPSAELYYLTARVLIFQQNYDKALQVLLDGQKYLDLFWRILFLNKLCQLYTELGDAEKLEATKSQLLTQLKSTDSLTDLRDQITRELQHEIDPNRSHNLITFLQVLDYYQDLTHLVSLTK